MPFLHFLYMTNSLRPTLGITFQEIHPHIHFLPKVGLDVLLWAPRVICANPLLGTCHILMQTFAFLICLEADNVFHLFPLVPGTK